MKENRVSLIKVCLMVVLFIRPFLLSAKVDHKLYVETISKAGKDGVTISHLDSLYTSAVHVDSSKAVFKSRKMSDSLTRVYTRFLNDFAGYLRENNFKWEQTAKCWNRIYFNANGTVEYYLFEFRTPITDDKLKTFKDLFSSFASGHKLDITASVNFAQCSPVTFLEK